MNQTASTIESLVITAISPDRPGIIQALSQTVRQHGGNWTESNFSALENVFVGIVKIDITDDKKADLTEALNALSAKEITIQFHQLAGASTEQDRNKETIQLKLDANDREGIIEEITTALAQANVNIVDLESACENASMAGYDMFTADLLVSLPDQHAQQDLVALLENISDDVMVSIVD